MTVAVDARLTGILCAVGASFAFSTNDMLVRLLSGGYPLHEIVLFRSSIALIFVLAVFAPLEGGLAVLRTRRPGMHMLRGLAVVIANSTFFAAIVAMPLAEATAIFFIAPLLIAAFSVWLLGEYVGPFRWGAIAVGLVGVLLVIRPTPEAFRIAAALPAVAATCYALLHIMTRKLGLTERASTMSFYIQAVFVIVSALFGLIAGDGRFLASDHPSLIFLLGPWVWPATGDLLFLSMVGVASGFGGYLISQAYRSAEAGLVAPFEYVSFVMAIFWGFAIWGEVPSWLSASGMALVLCSGLFLAWREARAGARLSARRASGRR